MSSTFGRRRQHPRINTQHLRKRLNKFARWWLIDRSLAVQMFGVDEARRYEQRARNAERI